jgi:hypothetical protein
MSSVKRVTKAKSAADLLEAQNKQARRAYELRQQGKSWWHIAEELGITESLAMARVDEAIRSASQLVDEYSKRSMLVMEVDRLDALQEAYWFNALSGDVKSAELILKISSQRSKLLGLDDITSQSANVHTVIVQGTSKEYIEALRVASERKVIEASDE